MQYGIARHWDHPCFIHHSLTSIMTFMCFRFNLYVKLFIVMEFPSVHMVVSYFSGIQVLSYLLHGMKALDSVFVFLIFVWKDDVRRSFRKQFVQTLRNKLGCIFRYRSTTPVIDNGNISYLSPWGSVCSSWSWYQLIQVGDNSLSMGLEF